MWSLQWFYWACPDFHSAEGTVSFVLFLVFYVKVEVELCHRAVLALPCVGWLVPYMADMRAFL